MLLVNHRVCFVVVKVDGSDVKPFKKNCSQHRVIDWNDSFYDGPGILIFRLLNEEEITFLTVVCKIFTPPLEIRSLCRGVILCWKGAGLEVANHVVKIFGRFWDFWQLNHCERDKILSWRDKNSVLKRGKRVIIFLSARMTYRDAV